MDTMQAFMKGEANRGNEMKVFDWDKAARLIKDKEPKEAGAGLAGDWEWTGGTIWSNSKPTPPGKTYTFLASTWATPEISLDGMVEDCYRMQSDTPNWDSDTYWPDSARKIIG